MLPGSPSSRGCYTTAPIRRIRFCFVLAAGTDDRATIRRATSQRADVVEFLKSMQVLPDGSPRVITDSSLATIQKRIRAAAKFLRK